MDRKQVHKDIVAEIIKKRADPWWPGEGLDGVYRSCGAWSDKGPCWEGTEIRTGIDKKRGVGEIGFVSVYIN